MRDQRHPRTRHPVSSLVSLSAEAGQLASQYVSARAALGREVADKGIAFTGLLATAEQLFSTISPRYNAA